MFSDPLAIRPRSTDLNRLDPDRDRRSRPVVVAEFFILVRYRLRSGATTAGHDEPHDIRHDRDGHDNGRRHHSDIQRRHEAVPIQDLQQHVRRRYVLPTVVRQPNRVGRLQRNRRRDRAGE